MEGDNYTFIQNNHQKKKETEALVFFPIIILTNLFLFKLNSFYLKEKQKTEDRELPSAGSLPQMPTAAGTGLG